MYPQMVISVKGSIYVVVIPDDNKPHTVTVTIFDPDSMDIHTDGAPSDGVSVFRDGFLVNAEGEITQPIASGIVEAADGLAAACKNGSLTEIKLALKAYKAARDVLSSPIKATRTKPLQINPKTSEREALPIPPLNREILPTEDELAQLEKCICPMSGCPVHPSVGEREG